MALFNVATATATELENLLSNRTVTSEQLVRAYLTQIGRYNGFLKAIIATAPTEVLINRARALDDERSAGRVRSPLHGIPIIIKDNTATHPSLGMETTAGTYALVGSLVKDSAQYVTQLVKAGAIILAKTNLSELSNFRGLHMPCGWSAVGGLTESPFVRGGKRWDDGFGGHSSTGGSSSGSAAGVAAGFAPVSIGTDTNGSILMPATRHDVYSLKPTLGNIAQEGICPISFDFDSAGPIAKSARDIAVMMDILVDRSKVKNYPEDGYTSFLKTSWAGLRIGVLEPREWRMPPHVVYPDKEAEDQQEREILAAYDKIESLGATIKKVTVAPLDGLEVNGMSLINRVMDSQFKRFFEGYLQGLEKSHVRTLQETMDFMKEHADKELPTESPNMKRLETAMSFQITDEEYKDALAQMRDWGRRQAVDKCLEENEVDIILAPGDSRINELSSTAGYPIATLPLSYLDLNGRPFGLAAVSTAHNEGILIHLMSAWEANFTNRKLPYLLTEGENGAKSEL